MSRPHNVVRNITFSPHNSTEDLTKNEYVNMKRIPRVSQTNIGYEGYMEDGAWHHHHYEDPSTLSTNREVLSNPLHRRRANDLYEPTGPLQPRKLFLGSLEKESNDSHLGKNGKDSCLSGLVLFLILSLSVTAVVLVVLVIMGFIGSTCSCAGQGSAQQSPGTKSVLSLQPAEEEIARMKTNITLLQTRMVQQLKTTNAIQTKLNTALLTIERLEATMISNNSSGEDWKNLEIKLNFTDTKLDIERERRLDLEEKANETIKKLNNVVGDVHKLENSMDRRKNQTEESRIKMWLSLNDTLAKQNQNIMKKINKTSQELRASDEGLNQRITKMNRTLFDKVENVSKMIAPMGPRGYNGTRGPSGVNGTKGLQGPSGFNGSQGHTGSQGIQGPAGAGNLSLCEHKIIASPPSTPDGFATNSAYISEPADKRILGVYCYTDRAALVRMEYVESGGVRKYACSCYGDSSYKMISNTMKCFLSYWQCPRYT